MSLAPGKKLEEYFPKGTSRAEMEKIYNDSKGDEAKFNNAVNAAWDSSNEWQDVSRKQPKKKAPTTHNQNNRAPRGGPRFNGSNPKTNPHKPKATKPNTQISKEQPPRASIKKTVQTPLAAAPAPAPPVTSSSKPVSSWASIVKKHVEIPVPVVEKAEVKVDTKAPEENVQPSKPETAKDVKTEEPKKNEDEESFEIIEPVEKEPKTVVSADKTVQESVKPSGWLDVNEIEQEYFPKETEKSTSDASKAPKTPKEDPKEEVAKPQPKGGFSLPKQSKEGSKKGDKSTLTLPDLGSISFGSESSKPSKASLKTLALNFGFELTRKGTQSLLEETETQLKSFVSEVNNLKLEKKQLSSQVEEFKVQLRNHKSMVQDFDNKKQENEKLKEQVTKLKSQSSDLSEKISNLSKSNSQQQQQPSVVQNTQPPGPPPQQSQGQQPPNPAFYSQSQPPQNTNQKPPSDSDNSQNHPSHHPNQPHPPPPGVLPHPPSGPNQAQQQQQQQQQPNLGMYGVHYQYPNFYPAYPGPGFSHNPSPRSYNNSHPPHQPHMGLYDGPALPPMPFQGQPAAPNAHSSLHHVHNNAPQHAQTTTQNASNSGNTAQNTANTAPHHSTQSMGGHHGHAPNAGPPGHHGFGGSFDNNDQKFPGGRQRGRDDVEKMQQPPGYGGSQSGQGQQNQQYGYPPPANYFVHPQQPMGYQGVPGQTGQHRGQHQHQNWRQ